MATPWKRSTKLVPVHLPSRHRPTDAVGLEEFNAPTPPPRLRVGRLELYTAIARTSLTANARTTTLQWRVDVTATELDHCIEEEPGEFQLSNDAKFLNSADLVALAGRIGAGVCDLYMSSLGYVWRDQAAAVLCTRNALADFIYEGKPTAGAGVVLAEAKCTTQRRSLRSTQSLVDKAYLRQVEPYLGAQSTVGKVLHGYAVGMCTPIGESAYICAAESAPPLPSDGDPNSSNPTSSENTGGSGSVPASAGQVVATVSLSTALGNYATALALTGKLSEARALTYARSGSLSPDRASEILVNLVDAHSNGFIEGHVRGTFFPYSAIRFRVRIEPLAALARLLGGMEKILDASQRIDLPLVPTVTSDDAGYAQFPDGLAGFSVSKEEAFEIQARLTLEERERYEQLMQKYREEAARRGAAAKTDAAYERLAKVAKKYGKASL